MNECNETLAEQVNWSKIEDTGLSGTELVK